MTKLAIDIAIIPPEEVIDKCIVLNKSLINKSSTYFELGKEDYLPHITLAMGSIKLEDVSKIKEIMKKISSHNHPIKINVREIKSSLHSDSVWNSSIVIEKTKDLSKIHEEIMDAISLLFLEESTPEMFYSTPKPEEDANALKWVKNFHETTVYDKYNPHISLGKGKIPDDKMLEIKTPFSFTGSRLVISHLGVHCTCRKILFEVELK